MATFSLRVTFASSRHALLMSLILLMTCFVSIGNAFLLHVPKSFMMKTPGSCLLLAATTGDDEVERMKKEAERIRTEIASFERSKAEAVQRELQEQEQIKSSKQKKRLQYSAEVPILKGDGSTVVERVDFPPRIKDGLSRIQVCTASLPLGIILGESEEFPGAVSVDEVTPDSNGQVAGVLEGDLLRACTACQVIMETPTWQILVGGIGMPKTKRFMFSVDNRPFEEVMDAIRSNRMDPEELPVILVLERQF